ncbi:MAG: hypothetical protein ACPGQD_01615 [Planctomycetota bacterium]
MQPGSIGQVIHGTTLATNALIVRVGSEEALEDLDLELAAVPGGDDALG